MRDWCKLAASRLVVRQALFYAIVVGSILAAINHGSAIVRGDIDAERAFKIALTCLVPYVVSTLSSVQALRNSGVGPTNIPKSVSAADTEDASD